MDTIIEDLLAFIERKKKFLSGLELSKVSVGLCYTGVMLSNEYAGLCHTPIEDIPHTHVKRMRNFHGMKVNEALSLARSLSMLERSIGIATINAVSQLIMDQEEYPRKTDVDIFDSIDLSGCNNAAVIGYIRPLVGKLRGKLPSVHVFERNPQLRGDALPETFAYQFLPKADVVLITGSSIVDGTIDHLLELSKNAKFTAVAGPSTSLIPEPFFARKVDAVGGVYAKGEDVIKAVAEGKSFSAFKDRVTKYVIERDEK